MELVVLAQGDVQDVLDVREILHALEVGFEALSMGTAVAPDRNEVAIPGAGFLLGMPAWQPGQNLTVKLVTAFDGNSELGLPRAQALICVFDPATGSPVAILDGTYITAARTAGSAALSARHLARQDARRLAIIGASVQGRAHLQFLPQVLDFQDIRIASRKFADAEALATLHPEARAVETNEEAVSGADVVCLCTNSPTPVIEMDWLSPGTHVTSVGYAPPGSEMPLALVRSGRLFVETRRSFEPPPAGCAELAGIDPMLGTELGEVLLGTKPGRQDDVEITVYKSSGHAVEDMVAATLAFQKAMRLGKGRVITL